MCVSTRIQYGLASALVVLLTLSTPARAETDIVANGALNFFFPHGAVSIAIGEPLHRHYENKDYRYEKRRYAPEYRKPHENYQHNSTYYKKAPKHYVVIKQPHTHYPVLIDSPRQKHHVRSHQNNEWQYSKPARRDYENSSKRDADHKRQMKGTENIHNKYLYYRQ